MWAMENRQLQRGRAWNWAVGEFLMLQGKQIWLEEETTHEISPNEEREAHSKKIMHVFTYKLRVNIQFCTFFNVLFCAF